MTVFFLFLGFRFFGVSIFWGFDFWGSFYGTPVLFLLTLRACVFFLCVDYGSKIRLKKRQLPDWAAIFVPYLSISLGVFSSRGEPAS